MNQSILRTDLDEGVPQPAVMRLTLLGLDLQTRLDDIWFHVR
jgi:hypothetical protein